MTGSCRGRLLNWKLQLMKEMVVVTVTTAFVKKLRVGEKQGKGQPGHFSAFGG